MKIFLDTSSVIKLYHSEEGTEFLHKLFEKNISEIYISEICVVEFSSAIWKKARISEISFSDAETLIKNFHSDLQKFTIIPVNSDILRNSLNLLNIYGKDGLRTLDSIQLSCAVSVKKNVDFFSTFDDKLKTLFDAENLETNLSL